MPLSRDTWARSRQLANLRRGGRRPPAGVPEPKSALELSLAALPANPNVRKTAGELQALLAGESTQHVGPADSTSVMLLAAALWGVKLCSDDISRYGPFNPTTGKARDSVAAMQRYLESAHRLADALGLSPQARARLGLTRARATAEEELLRALAESAPKPPTVTTLTAGEPEPPGGGVA